MSKIDYQVLREAAVAIETVATPQKLLAFRMKVTPQVVLALLDERDALNERLAELEADLAGLAEDHQKRLSQLSRLMQLLSWHTRSFRRWRGECDVEATDTATYRHH
ncbi:Uncharacterised protein [Escherichia coli]|uniref:ead/Ea22-like family protein n=1 Tax=Escherichia coli TaxID=562 RepID=UPI000DFB46F5|nr:ead/Ea22-like family protein [Escherichia coli]STH05302.1 Uncharacterised protein [Escherichia coli]